MTDRDKLIKGCFLVSVDPGIGNIDGCDILIREGKIVEVRPDIRVIDAEIVDGTDMIATPGYVDTHHHLWQGLLRGTVTDWSVQDYAKGIRMFAASFVRPEDMYAAQLHGALEKLNAGTTTIADYCHNINSPDHATESLRGVKESGARVVWGFGFNRPPLEAPAFPTMADRAAFLRNLAKDQFSSSNALVTLGICPEESYFWNTPDYVRPQFAMARELGARIFLHANSSRNPLTETVLLDAKILSDMGLLGPDVVLVHMGITDPLEWKLVADSGAKLSFTPETEMQMSLGWPNVGVALRYGIDFGFGIDITSNNSADTRFALRLFLQAERHRLNEGRIGQNLDGTPHNCAEVHYWGTQGAANVMGLGHSIGSISPGKRADIVLYDGKHITLTGWNRMNPEAVLVCQAGPESVDTVLVDGAFVKRRKHLVANVSRVCRQLSDASTRVYEDVARHGGFKAIIDKGFGAFADQVDAGR